MHRASSCTDVCSSCRWTYDKRGGGIAREVRSSNAEEKNNTKKWYEGMQNRGLFVHGVTKSMIGKFARLAEECVKKKCKKLGLKEPYQTTDDALASVILSMIAYAAITALHLLQNYSIENDGDATTAAVLDLGDNDENIAKLQEFTNAYDSGVYNAKTIAARIEYENSASQQIIRGMHIMCDTQHNRNL